MGFALDNRTRLTTVTPVHAGVELPRARFVEEVVRRGLVHLAHDAFPGEVDAARLAAAGELVLVRTDTAGEELEACLRLPGGVVAFVDLTYGRVHCEVAGPAPAAAGGALAALRDRFARPEPASAAVTFAFWCRG
ncbi:MAG TPA: hypothetical protein VN213_11785, partial [Solirubrobacteraceae bacterium]|nr:hypothetical protein [Solirubrobacteraceae bacterium]